MNKTTGQFFPIGNIIGNVVIKDDRFSRSGKKQEGTLRKAIHPIQIKTAEDFGKAIRHQRKSGGLTLTETAGLTNVGVRFLSEMENGKPTVRLDKLLHVLEALGFRLHMTTPEDSNLEWF